MTSRIATLARRDWTEGSAEIADALTDDLRTPSGTMRLRPVQAVALLEAAEQRGLFGHIRVGGGKTLISGLLPPMLGATRPILIVPASLREKTQADFELLRVHWKIPHTIRVVSYSCLGLAHRADLLETYEPDLIIADEAHKLKNVTTSAVARRVARYMSLHPSTAFCALSGTLTKGALLDYAHILAWSLRYRAPIPVDEDSIAEWSRLLDNRAPNENDFSPLAPALGVVRNLREARMRFQERLSSAPGVIISRDSFSDTRLTIRTETLEPPDVMIPHFRRLREEWCAPDGWYLADAAFEVWRVARTLALGFAYVHDPRPPEDWFNARRDWARFVRRTLEGSLEFDSEFQVAAACDSGRLESREWVAWQEIKPTHTPNSVPVWLSDHAINAAIEWERNHGPALIWCEHVAFAERLAAVTGWPYYGEGGVDSRGESISRACGETAIVSVAANSTGRNLQAWNRALVVSPLSNGVAWEQLLGRSHREGQTRDVEIHTWIGCEENAESITRSVRDAEYIFETTGQEQKLLNAEIL